MTKVELLKLVQDSAEAQGHKVSRKDVEAVVDALTEVLVSELKNQKEATIPGLLKIVLADVAPKAARVGRNPKTGESVQIPAKPASSKLRARFLKHLKDAVLP